MADENIMSLIQNLFVDDGQSLGGSIDFNENNNNKFINHQFINNEQHIIGSTVKANGLCNEPRKLLIKQLSQTTTIQQTQPPNATSFYNDLTTNPLLKSLTMKDSSSNHLNNNEMIDLNDELLFSNKMFTLNDIQSQLSKANYDLLNNNTTPTTQATTIVEQTTALIKDLPIISSPILSDCSFKSANNNNNLLTPTSSSFADLIRSCTNTNDENFNNFGLSNLTVQRQQPQQQQLQQQQFTTTTNNNNNNDSPDSFMFTEEDRFESQIRSLANEIHSTVQLHMNGLHMRREALLQQLEHIKKIYLDVLRKKKQQQQQLINLDNSKFILPNIMFNKPDSALYKAISQLGFLNTPAFGPFCTASGDGLEFAVPGVNSSFTIETRNCFNDELLVGRESISIEILALFNENLQPNSNLSNTIVVDSTSSLSSSSSNNRKSPSILDYTSKSIVPHTFFDHNNGKYTVTYNVPILKSGLTPLELVIKINVNGLPINDSPMRIQVQTQKRQNWKLATTFGSEGNEIGSLCRPWGVTIVKMPSQLLLNHQQSSQQQQQQQDGLINDNSNGSSNQTHQTPHLTSSNNIDMKSIEQHYLIGIADRSNNRIQLLDYDSKTQQINVINVFGSGPGTRPGMFDRPAGICINLSLGHIIVADKDNHRIQVFSLTGRYLFKFGEKGSRIGFFNYPWDLDCCAHTHQIAVSDTRNRRIQLFTPYGQYINHFSLLLDSPRGVTFLPDKRLIVSDFNKHRILIFDKHICNPNLNNKDGTISELPGGFTNLNSPKIIGFGEGSQWGEFLRPQGVAVSGNSIICADSRNNRICIYNMLTQTFEYLSDELALDRPSDLSVVDENILVIMDFGNNRLQILQR